MLEILKIVLKWKNQILIFTVVAVLASVIITMPFIMPPYYKSNMVFYLSNPTSTDRAALFNEKEVGGVGIFGGKEDINRFSEYSEFCSGQSLCYPKIQPDQTLQAGW
jgi:hypothetical protein